MTLTLTFDQTGAGIPAGQSDRARTDIVSSGPVGGRAHDVTITIAGVPVGATADIVLLDEPPSSNPLLTQLSAAQWKLEFDQDCWGPFRLRCRVVQDGAVLESVTRRISIRSPQLQLHYPALAERTDPNATRVTTAPSVALTEMNEGGTNRPLVGFYRALVEQIEAVAGQAAGGADADASHVLTTTAATVTVGASYIAAFTATVITLPDAAAADVRGRRLAVTFTQGHNIVQSDPALSTPNYLVSQQGGLSPDPAVELPSGTYEFRAFYDSTVYPIGFWVVRRLAATYGRRSIDVDFCLPGDIPKNYTTTPLGLAGQRFVIAASPTTPERLPFDAGGSYPEGATLLVPFDGLTSGIFKVNRNNSATDWELELLERAPEYNTALGEASETEYRIRYGDNWGGRRFLSNVAGVSTVPSDIALQRAPLELYPGDGVLLDGTASNSGSYTYQQLLVGKLNLLNTSASGGQMALELITPPDAARITGERFAIKVVSLGGGRPVQITPPSGQLIESPDNLLGPDTTFFSALGTYAEWVIDYAGTWRIVSFMPGSAGA